ncbi:zinc metallopeptidase [bacterium]|nr:zinc metallopeptidase [bacterium]
MFFPIFDPTMVLLIPAIILAVWAQSKVNRAFKKFSRIANQSGLTGAQVARRILDQNGLNDIPVEATSGFLSDHYDPMKRRVVLSEANYTNPSVAAMAVAAHEVGHAIQHANGYSMLKLRGAMAGTVQIGSFLAWPIVIIGFLFASPGLIDAGIILFSLVVAFHMVTLPVEFDASRRAIAILSTDGYVVPAETDGAKKVLNAAAWTYVAAAAGAILTLIRLFLLRGMIGND